jgi:hypothetical protein
MPKWWQRIVQVRTGLVALSLWLAVIILPLRVQQLPEALRWWGNMMPDRETLLILLSGVLVAWIFWTDLRPSVYRWWSDRKVGDVNLRDAIWWIEKKSAWWRWQVAQGVLGQDEWANYNLVASRLYWQAKRGDLTIRARRKSKINREDISKNFWQLGTLEAVRDDRTLWKIIVRPCNDLAKHDEDKVTELGYIAPSAKWKEIRRLWPEKDRQMDRLTTKLIKQKTKKAA